MYQIHRKYLFSKINIIIVSIVLILALICYLSTVNINFTIFERWLNRKEGWINFYNTTLFVGKFIGIILSIFILGSSFCKEQDGYNVLFLRTKKNRIKYYYSKSLTINMIVFLIIFLIGLSGIITISSFSSWFNNYKELIVLFLNLSLISLVYGNFSIILIQIFKSQLVIILPFVVFVIIEVLIDLEFINYIIIFFPTIKDSPNLINCLHSIILIIVYNFIGSVIYYHRDLT